MIYKRVYLGSRFEGTIHHCGESRTLNWLVTLHPIRKQKEKQWWAAGLVLSLLSTFCPGPHSSQWDGAAHIQSCSATPGTPLFPVSTLAVTDQDRGCPLQRCSLVLCEAHSPQTALWRFACRPQSAVPSLGLAGIPVLHLGFWPLSQESLAACC